MVSACELRELVSGYLRDVVDLDEFSSRFAVLSDDIEETGDDDAVRLSYQIESRLADASAGFVSELELRESLIPCLLVVNVEPDFRAEKQSVKKQETTSAYVPAGVSFA